VVESGAGARNPADDLVRIPDVGVVDDDPLSDESLVAGRAGGDGDAGPAKVSRPPRRGYGLALRLVGDPNVAEDVSQEAFTRAWRHAGAYDSRRGSVTTWLLTITRNLAIDSLRVRRADPLDPDDLVALTGLTPSPEDGPAVDDLARLRAAVADLPADQQRALVLAAWYGRTAKEISASEGIPVGTAKTRIRAGMLKLRASLVTAGEEAS
jgi:RNA polymerase sigma-70 factor (ECF subfamily)